LSVEPVVTATTLYSQLSDCLMQDQYRLRRRLVNSKKMSGKADQQPVLQKIAADIQRSVSQRQQRQAAMPVINYPPELPVVASKDQIKAAIATNQVVIIAGETGSGKTTQKYAWSLDAA